MLALLFAYLSFSFLVEASPFSAVRDVAAKLSPDVVSATSITNVGQAQCNSVGSYSCGLPSNTTIILCDGNHNAVPVAYCGASQRCTYIGNVPYCV
ncbi:hypothetical protein IFR04_011179 [Cadophora malorum]|uniref:Uncharacterized protein n=1 Tax=Cadophora malorum TaxID=108018 RepID=A0A8H7T952_9HELO|nr:hypothetical protein IFR04_011179 [Cadophora malorum]